MSLIDLEILECFKIKVVNIIAENTMAPKFQICYDDESKPMKIINSYIEFENYRKELIDQYNIIKSRNNKLDKI